MGCFGLGEKFAAKVNVSAVITSHGTASLVLLPADTTLTGKRYLEILKNSHIPAVRRAFPANDFTWIHVTWALRDSSQGYVEYAEQLSCSAVAMNAVGQCISSHGPGS